jgi:hypothetical protein
VGNLPSTLLEDFVITARHLVVMLVFASSKIASSRRRHLVLGMFGHVPFWGRSLCWHIVDTWISPSHKSLFFYYIWIQSCQILLFELNSNSFIYFQHYSKRNFMEFHYLILSSQFECRWWAQDSGAWLQRMPGCEIEVAKPYFKNGS